MGMIRIPELFRAGLVASSGGLADMVPVYAGSANGSLSAWAFVAPLPGEIPVYGARRVRNWMAGSGQDPRTYLFGRTASGGLATITAGVIAPDLSPSAYRIQIDPGNVGSTTLVYSFIDWAPGCPAWGVSSGLVQQAMASKFSVWMRATETNSQYLYVWPFGYLRCDDQWRRYVLPTQPGADFTSSITTGGGHLRYVGYPAFGLVDICVWRPQMEFLPPVAYGQPLQAGEWIDPDTDYGFGAPGVAYFDTTRDFDVSGSYTIIPLANPPRIPDIVGLVPRAQRGNRVTNAVNARSGQLGGIGQDGVLFQTGSWGPSTTGFPMGFFPIRVIEATASGQPYNPRWAFSIGTLSVIPHHLQLIIKAGSATGITLGLYQGTTGWNSKILVDIRSGMLLSAPNSGGVVTPGVGSNREKAWSWVRPLGDGWSLISYAEAPDSGGTLPVFYIEISTPANPTLSGTAALLYYIGYVGMSFGDLCWSPPIGTASGFAASLTAAWQVLPPPEPRQGSLEALTTFIEFVPPPGWGGQFRPARLADASSVKPVAAFVEFCPSSDIPVLTSTLTATGNFVAQLSTRSWEPFTVHRLALSEWVDPITKRFVGAIAYSQGGVSSMVQALQYASPLASLGPIAAASGWLGSVASNAIQAFQPWPAGVRQFRQYAVFMREEQLVQMLLQEAS